MTACHKAYFAGASHYEVFKHLPELVKEADKRKAYECQKAVSSRYGRAVRIFRDLGETQKLLTQLIRQFEALGGLFFFRHEAIQALREIQALMKAANPSFKTTVFQTQHKDDSILQYHEYKYKLDQEKIEQAGGRDAYLEFYFTSMEVRTRREIHITEGALANVQEQMQAEGAQLLVETEFSAVLLWESSGLDGPVLCFSDFVRADKLSSESAQATFDPGGSSTPLWDQWMVISKNSSETLSGWISPFSVLSAAKNDTLFVLILHRQRLPSDAMRRNDWNLCLHKHCISGRALLTASDGKDGSRLVAGRITCQVPCDPTRIRNIVYLAISPNALAGAQVIAQMTFTWNKSLLKASGRISGSSNVDAVAALGLVGIGREVGELWRLCRIDATPRCAECGLREETASPRLLKCGSCRVALYCNVGCQKKHWQRHKGECQRMREEIDEQIVLGQEEQPGGEESKGERGVEELARRVDLAHLSQVLMQLDSFLGVNGISRFSPAMIQCLPGTDAAAMY